MKFPKFIYGLLCLSAACSWLASCSRTTPRYRIGVSQCSDDEWRRQMNSEITREARFYDDVQVEVRTSKDDNVRQEEDIRYFINEGVDLLVVAPNEARSITPVVEEAYGKGIPVILEIGRAHV